MENFFKIYVVLLFVLGTIDAKNQGINNPIAFIFHVLLWMPMNFIIGLQYLFALVVGWGLIYFVFS